MCGSGGGGGGGGVVGVGGDDRDKATCCPWRRENSRMQVELKQKLDDWNTNGQTLGMCSAGGGVVVGVGGDDRDKATCCRWRRGRRGGCGRG